MVHGGRKDTQLTTRLQWLTVIVSFDLSSNSYIYMYAPHDFNDYVVFGRRATVSRSSDNFGPAFRIAFNTHTHIHIAGWF